MSSRLVARVVRAGDAVIDRSVPYPGLAVEQLARRTSRRRHRRGRRHSWRRCAALTHRVRRLVRFHESSVQTDTVVGTSAASRPGSRASRRTVSDPSQKRPLSADWRLFTGALTITSVVDLVAGVVRATDDRRPASSAESPPGSRASRHRSPTPSQNWPLSQLPSFGALTIAVSPTSSHESSVQTTPSSIGWRRAGLAVQRGRVAGLRPVAERRSVAGKPSFGAGSRRHHFAASSHESSVHRCRTAGRSKLASFVALTTTSFVSSHESSVQTTPSSIAGGVPAWQSNVASSARRTVAEQAVVAVRGVRR